jgi:hypothetical protein
LSDFDYSKIESVEFWRAPGKNVGFVRNEKCGSTFFSNVFAANGWSRQLLHQINWDKDYVFSFVMDPYIRHVKGMVEDAVNLGAEKIMLANLGIKFWHNLPWIGTHSMPMSVRFGDQVHSIDWIPIDIGIVSTETIVDSLLEPHGVTVDWAVPVDRNESSPYEKELFHKFSQMLNSQEKQDLLKIICTDYVVYNKAVQKYSKHIK